MKPAGARSTARPAHERRDLALEASLGETLTDIVGLSNAAMTGIDDPALVEQILAIRRRADDALEDLRSARDSRARMYLRARRLLPNLRELTLRFQAETKILTELRAPACELVLPDDVAWAIYSVADETFESLERRSRATGIVVVVRAGSEEASMSIRDDGVGLLARQGSGWPASPHAALRAMKRAVAMVGGDVSVASVRPRGLLVRAVVPLRVA
jgi:signal transduction histidine kinase